MNHPSIHFHTDQVVVGSLAVTPSTTLQDVENAIGAKARVEPETKWGINALYAVWDELGIEGRLEPSNSSLLISTIGIRVRGYSPSDEIKSFYTGDATVNGINIPQCYSQVDLQKLGINSTDGLREKIYESKGKHFAIQITDMSSCVTIVAFKSGSARQERPPSDSSNSNPPFTEYMRKGCGEALGKLMLGLVPLLFIAALIIAAIICLALYFMNRQ